MRVTYVPIGEKVWLENMMQTGHGMSAYSGERFQRGYGLGAIFGPLLRTILPIVKGVGKAVGKQALRTGVEVASDVLQGDNFAQAIKTRGKAGAKRLLTKGVRKLQRGRGLGIRPRQPAKGIKAIRKRRKPVIRKKKKKQRTDAFGLY